MTAGLLWVLPLGGGRHDLLCVAEVLQGLSAVAGGASDGLASPSGRRGVLLTAHLYAAVPHVEPRRGHCALGILVHREATRQSRGGQAFLRQSGAWHGRGGGRGDCG